MIQWNLNVEREIAKNLVLKVGYLGDRGVHLLAFHDFNPPVPTIDAYGVYHFASPAGVQNPRINPAFGSLDLNDTTSYSRFNAMQVALNYRFSDGVQAYLSYMFSHCIDDTYTYGGLGGNNASSAVENPYNERIDTGNCATDVRHNLTINAIYALPFRGNRLKEGWQVSGIETWHTGDPFTVVDGFDQALLQNNFDAERPNYIGGCNLYAGAHTATRWFNPDCFALQPVGTLGNAGRNIGTSPGYMTTDFALLKNTRIADTTSLQFRAELFNIFNQVNFNYPSLGVFSSNGSVLSTAGAITSIIGTSRQIQFGLKFLF